MNSFDAAQARPAPTGGIERLFVSVGTDYHKFDRLIGWLDEWFATQPKVESAIVQRGTSATPSNVESVDYVQRTQLIEEFQRATVVVTHGGPATILECRSNGIVPIVVPREAAHDEHVNDHQVDFCKRLAGHGDIQMARDKETFFALLNEAVERGAAKVAVDDGHAQVAIGNFEDAMIELLGPRAAPEPQALAEVFPIRKEASKIPVVFIGAVPRSGSTIISDLLNEDPHIVNIGELVHLWERGITENNLCGCGQAFNECEFWQQVGKVAFGGWEQVSGDRMRQLQLQADRTRHIPRLLFSPASPFFNPTTNQYGAVLSRVLRAVIEVSGSPIVVDTSKHVATALLLRRIPDVDLRVVHIVRDPRGVAHSWTKVIDRPEATEDDKKMATLHPARIGLRWLWFNWAFGNMDRLGVATTTIRYEDFVESPVEMLDQILAFAGLESTARNILSTDTPLVLEPGHSVAGNPRRLERKPVEIRSDEGWRTALDPKMSKIVERITSVMLPRYKYSEES